MVGDLFQWGPGASAMDRRRTQICVNNNRIGAISTIPPENINQIVLLEYFASADDVHKNIFIADNRRLACEVHKLSSTSEVNRRSVQKTDNDSASNVHLCRNGVPGMSAAYENQTLARLLSYVYQSLCFVLNFFQSAASCRISHWEIKNALMRPC